jgi:hypothetical protein
MVFGPGGRDVSKLAWDSSFVGIWYGGWSAPEFNEALKQTTVAQQIAHLSQLPAQSKLYELGPREFNTCLRFSKIDPNDWVYVYFDDALHFARVQGPLETSESEVFNLKSSPDGPPELFKYRRISEKKSFRLGQLPLSFLILRSAGRNNVYEHSDSYRQLVKMLAESQTETEVWDRFHKLSIVEWLKLASDKTWEAVCEAYLILEQDFVPVGLKVGGTLADFDIVGYSRGGARILAQCKKHPDPVHIEPSFVSLCGTFSDPKELYYFAYGGVVQAPPEIQVIDSVVMQSWMDTTANGKLYKKLLGLA